MGKLIFKLYSDLRSIYQSKPPEVTVLSTGALSVDAAQLLSSPAAQKQIQALKDFPVGHSLVAEQPEAHPGK
jgi:hypothetical protein